MQTKKRKKASRYHGRGMGTSGTGARKNQRKKGNRGGKGMSGTGKRADQKKTLITKLYGNAYFGKQGITSKRTQRDKSDIINLMQIQENIENFIKKGLAEKTAKGIEINLKTYKILSEGKIRDKIIITAKSASASAIKEVEKAGGKIILPEKRKEAEKKKEKPGKK